MKKVKFTLSIGFVRAYHEKVVELEKVVEFDDAVCDEEIEETYLEWRDSRLEGGWEVVEVTDDAL